MELIRLQPGDQPPETVPGDVGLVEGNSWQSDLVRLVDGGPYSHVITAVDELWWADPQAYGVVKSKLEAYDDVPLTIVRYEAPSNDREQIQQYLKSVLAREYSYSWLGFFFAGLGSMSGGRLMVRRANTHICSSLCAAALTRAGFVWPKPPGAMTPRDLAEHFGALVSIGQSTSTVEERKGYGYNPNGSAL